MLSTVKEPSGADPKALNLAIQLVVKHVFQFPEHVAPTLTSLVKALAGPFLLSHLSHLLTTFSLLLSPFRYPSRWHCAATKSSPGILMWKPLEDWRPCVEDPELWFKRRCSGRPSCLYEQLRRTCW